MNLLANNGGDAGIRTLLAGESRGAQGHACLGASPARCPWIPRPAHQLST